jgi:hypothetical protein
MSHPFTASVWRERNWYVSQCLEVDVASQGEVLNATVQNSYKDDKSGEWKETASISLTDLAVVSQLTSKAFEEIVQLK